MAGPLRIKASSFPATAGNFEGFQELSTGEIKDTLAYILTKKFSDDTDGSGTAELNVNGSGDSIGTFTNRERTETVGTHPAAGGTTDTLYTFKQITSAASESVTRPVRWADGEMIEMTDAEIDSEILDPVITAMVTEDANTTGIYKVSTGTPTGGGTWVQRYTISETQVDGTDVTYYLWQKTVANTTPNVDRHFPVKLDSGKAKEMTQAEVESLTAAMRNRIVASGVGTYLLQASTPSATGTWAVMGSAMDDIIKSIATVTYSGAYASAFTGYYITNFAGTYSTAFTGYYTGNFTGSYTLYYGGYVGGYFDGTYSTAFTGYYTGNFTGYYAGSFAGNYTGYFTGNYDGTTITTTPQTQETKHLYIRTA
tara:strand:- start:991 stop:2094 length:1104 start_codon:yes stop_codon:yes gene_type:complete